MGTLEAFEFIAAAILTGGAARPGPASGSRPGEFRHEREHDRRAPSAGERASAVRYCITNDLI